MKSGIHDIRRIIQTNCDVFQINEFTDNILNYDEQDPIGPYQHWENSELYQ